jgi:hypothetical protein
MTKPTKRKRPEPAGARARIVVSEVALRRAAITCAAGTELDTMHPRWRRSSRELRRAAIGMVAESLELARRGRL